MRFGTIDSDSIVLIGTLKEIFFDPDPKYQRTKSTRKTLNNIPSCSLSAVGSMILHVWVAKIESVIISFE